jgi:hypothetical protein
MPRYLDVHNDALGLTAEDFAQAQAENIAVQGTFGVRYLRYWYDPMTGKIFCLSDAPSKEALIAVHEAARHGTPDEIFEVQEYQ